MGVAVRIAGDLVHAEVLEAHRGVGAEQPGEIAPRSGAQLEPRWRLGRFERRGAGHHFLPAELDEIEAAQAQRVEDVADLPLRAEADFRRGEGGAGDQVGDGGAEARIPAARPLDRPREAAVLLDEADRPAPLEDGPVAGDPFAGAGRRDRRGHVDADGGILLNDDPRAAEVPRLGGGDDEPQRFSGVVPRPPGSARRESHVSTSARRRGRLP